MVSRVHPFLVAAVGRYAHLQCCTQVTHISSMDSKILVEHHLCGKPWLRAQAELLKAAQGGGTSMHHIWVW